MGAHSCFPHTNCFVPGNKMILRHLWWAFHHLSAHITICKAAAFRHGAPLFSQVLRLSRGAFWHLRWIGPPSVGVMRFFLFFFPPLSSFPLPSRTAELTPADKSCLKCSPTSLLYFIYLYILKVSISSSVPGFDISCLRKRCCTHVLALMYK